MIETRARGAGITLTRWEKMALKKLLQDNGGLFGLARKFYDGGLWLTFASWGGTGDNQMVSQKQIEAVLGNDQIQSLAELLGIDTAQASDFLAKTLPQLIDKLTPDGTFPKRGEWQNTAADLLSMNEDELWEIVRGDFLPSRGEERERLAKETERERERDEVDA